MNPSRKKRNATDNRGQNVTVRQFLLQNLHCPKDEKVHKFKVPLSVIGQSLDHLGDFPYKNPGEVRFAKPALFIRGTQSKYVPDEALPIIGQFFPLFKLVDIDAGHWVISEKPELFRQGTLKRAFHMLTSLLIVNSGR